MSKWNVGSIANQYLTSKLNGSKIADEIDINELDSEEKHHLKKLLIIYYFIALENVNTDWSTRNIGTFFIKTAMENGITLHEIHDTFTPPNDNVSWPDIAVMYNLKDFRVLMESESILATPAKYKELEPCRNLSCSVGRNETGKRYSSFQRCFDNLENEEDKWHHEHHEHTFKKEYISKKYVQPSPCSDLEKFPSCKEYCTWHKDYFKTVHNDHFIQAMSYASYQRKIIKDSTSQEKDIAGRTKIPQISLKCFGT